MSKATLLSSDNLQVCDFHPGMINVNAVSFFLSAQPLLYVDTLRV
jgi:hypothetical protein